MWMFALILWRILRKMGVDSVNKFQNGAMFSQKSKDLSPTQNSSAPYFFVCFLDLCGD